MVVRLHPAQQPVAKHLLTDGVVNEQFVSHNGLEYFYFRAGNQGHLGVLREDIDAVSFSLLELKIAELAKQLGEQENHYSQTGRDLYSTGRELFTSIRNVHTGDYYLLTVEHDGTLTPVLTINTSSPFVSGRRKPFNLLFNLLEIKNNQFYIQVSDHHVFPTFSRIFCFTRDGTLASSLHLDSFFGHSYRYMLKPLSSVDGEDVRYTSGVKRRYGGGVLITSGTEIRNFYELPVLPQDLAFFQGSCYGNIGEDSELFVKADSTGTLQTLARDHAVTPTTYNGKLYYVMRTEDSDSSFYQLDSQGNVTFLRDLTSVDHIVRHGNCLNLPSVNDERECIGVYVYSGENIHHFVNRGSGINFICSSASGRFFYVNVDLRDLPKRMFKVHHSTVNSRADKINNKPDDRLNQTLEPREVVIERYGDYDSELDVVPNLNK